MNLSEVSSKEAEVIIYLLSSCKDSVFDFDFNWLGLGELGELNFKKNIECNSIEKAKIWARISLYAYNFLYESNHNENESFSFSLKILRVKVNSINKLGVIKGDDLFDPDLAFNWVFESLSSTCISNVIEECKSWRSADKESILKLRRIKNILNVVDLFNNKTLIKEANISQWLKIKNQLP